MDEEEEGVEEIENVDNVKAVCMNTAKKKQSRTQA